MCARDPVTLAVASCAILSPWKHTDGRPARGISRVTLIVVVLHRRRRRRCDSRCGARRAQFGPRVTPNPSMFPAEFNFDASVIESRTFVSCAARRRRTRSILSPPSIIGDRQFTTRSRPAYPMHVHVRSTPPQFATIAAARCCYDNNDEDDDGKSSTGEWSHASY